jgi:hypothetical protein
MARPLVFERDKNGNSGVKWIMISRPAEMINLGGCALHKVGPSQIVLAASCRRASIFFQAGCGTARP